MNASSLVLMNKENGVLTKELGSYEIESGLEFVFKAYVEDGSVNLFLTTDRDVDDDEYNEIYDNYNEEPLNELGFTVEEIEEEYNPVWRVKLLFKEEHNNMKQDLNTIIKYHEEEIKRIYEQIKK